MDEQHIPIDINTSKLLEWLISRRHVNKDWQNNIIKIREKINNAIQDMPEHDGIVELLKGQHVNYFHCLKIIEILKETEADTKNLFGRYGSQRMKDWQDIVQLYQRDNLYLAEAAQILIRNVNFEVPSLRKQKTKCEQIQVECEKAIKDYVKTETVTLNDFNVTCKQLGITGKLIKHELIELLSELPDIYENVFIKTKKLQEAFNLYTAFVKFHTGHAEVLPLLKYVIANGNTTVYQYKYDKKPISVEMSLIQKEDEKENSDIIDFGEDIDFGESVDFDTNNVAAESSAIDWGNDEGFEIVEHSDLDSSMKESEMIMKNRDHDGVARGEEALTILDNPNTRELFLNDLAELEAFLTMRNFEMSNESDLLSISQLQDAPAELQMQTVEVVTNMLDNVKIVINDLLNKRTQHLHNIKHSPKYVDILSASLNQKLTIVDRLRANVQIANEKINEARLQIKNVQPIINLIIEKTKQLRADIEGDISKKYKGRPVHIVGAVNTL